MAEEQQRELCPNLTSTQDLVNHVGGLSVDILNKEKVLMGLWNTIDGLSRETKSQNEEIESLKSVNLQQETVLSSREDRITNLESSKEQVRENQVIVEENYSSDIKKLKDNHQIEINAKDGEIQNLQKVVESIEAEAVVNQEEIRKELMETQNEINSLKESLKPQRKVRKKKKTNAKPARA